MSTVQEHHKLSNSELKIKLEKANADLVKARKNFEEASKTYMDLSDESISRLSYSKKHLRS